MLCRRRALVLLTNARASCDSPKTLLRSSVTTSVNSFSLKRCNGDEQSFTVSYLISSCGLSPQTALRVSQKVNFRSAEQPDSVLTLLRNHGFTNTHIAKLARVRPDVLSVDPKHTVLPKLEFFQSIGIPTAEIANICSSWPTLFRCSLSNQIIPAYNFLKDEFLLDDKQVGRSLKYSPRLLATNLQKKIPPKIATLRELNVPASTLSFMVTYHPTVLLQSSQKFDKTVKEVVEMGVNPLKTTFSLVLTMMSGLSKSTWEHKLKVYRKCGWSEDDLHLALKKNPICMSLSEKKITSAMDLLVNEMGWKPAAIARVSSVLSYSLKRRTIPRFVTKYAEDVPQLLDVFNGKMSLAELGIESEETCLRKLS